VIGIPQTQAKGAVGTLIGGQANWPTSLAQSVSYVSFPSGRWTVRARGRESHGPPIGIVAKRRRRHFTFDASEASPAGAHAPSSIPSASPGDLISCCFRESQHSHPGRAQRRSYLLSDHLPSPGGFSMRGSEVHCRCQAHTECHGDAGAARPSREWESARRGKGAIFARWRDARDVTDGRGWGMCFWRRLGHDGELRHLGVGIMGGGSSPMSA
jgi:hypothetical protein